MISPPQPVEVPVRPWFKDHCFNGKTILPAVEIMEILASAVQSIRPGTHPWLMGSASFAKFIEIPEEEKTLSLLIDWQAGEKDEICMKLLSRIRLKKISRIKEHAQLTFSLRPSEPTKLPATLPPIPSRARRSIDTKRIYQELVPFGPTYRTLTGHLHLSAEGAWGTLLSPVLSEEQAPLKLLGSPFPLDGAMHAACVHGQSVVDFVPFPVGFDQRIIHRPTKAGKRYETRIIPVSRSREELVYDLSIYDAAATPHETVRGLRMRDISGGRISPPNWLKAGQPGNTLPGDEMS